MKNALLILGLSIMAIGCSKNDETSNPAAGAPAAQTPENPAITTRAVEGENKVLMLKVDASTGEFEGGKELSFDDAATFTIAADYVTPADFGSVKLFYEELGAPLFGGTIVWAGTGEMTYPELDTKDMFPRGEALPMPGAEMFHEVRITEGPSSLEPDLQMLWGAIGDIELVNAYRQSNPDAKISLFLYTPSVGIGNPAEWDWFVIFKN